MKTNFNIEQILKDLMSIKEDIVSMRDSVKLKILNTPMRAPKPTDVQAVKMRYSMVRSGKPRFWYINGDRYASATLAAAELGISISTVKHRCNGRVNVKGGEATYYPPKDGWSSRLQSEVL